MTEVPLKKQPTSGPGLSTYLGNTLKSKTGTLQTSTIDSDIVLVYFSAHWCPPCRNFTPMLANLYQTAKQANKSIEVVFASMDRTPQDFQAYFNSMPWLAVPYEDRQRIQVMSSLWGIQGIPNIAVLDGTGNKLFPSGRDPTVNLIRQLGIPAFIRRLPDKSSSVSSDNHISNSDLQFIDLYIDRSPPLDQIIERIANDKSLTKAETQLAYRTLSKIFSNIAGDLSNPKFRVLKKSNPVLQSKIFSHPSFIALLRNGGFRETLDMYVMPSDAVVDAEELKTLSDTCEGLAESISVETPKAEESKTEESKTMSQTNREIICDGNVCRLGENKQSENEN